MRIDRDITRILYTCDRWCSALHVWTLNVRTHACTLPAGVQYHQIFIGKCALGAWAARYCGRRRRLCACVANSVLWVQIHTCAEVVKRGNESAQVPALEGAFVAK